MRSRRTTTLVHQLGLALLVAGTGCAGNNTPPRLEGRFTNLDHGLVFADTGRPGLDTVAVDLHRVDRASPDTRATADDQPRPADSGAGPYFTDVPPTHPAYTEIQWVRSKQIMAGCQSTPPLFCPSDPTTRAALAVALVRMKHGAAFNYPPAPYFTDVPATHWAFSHVQRLAADGITAGCATNLYCPETSATRAQAAVMLVRMKFGDSFSYPQAPFFTDVPATHLAFKYIQKLRDANITAGCGTSTFCPDDPLLRRDLAVFLYRAQTL